MGIRWGLCCQFVDAPVRFRHATHRYVSSLPFERGREYLADIARANAIALAHAVERCRELGIGAFRITSQVVPLATHPVSGFVLEDLPQADVIVASFRAAGMIAAARDVRLSLHPDQFVVLNSERPDVVASSIAEMNFQAQLAALVGADTICLHAGSAAGGKSAALERLRRALPGLSDEARARLALENDDRSYTVADLLPLCEAEGIPLVYDVHHHRVNTDPLTVEEATQRAAATWRGREPWAHISSPRGGWTSSGLRSHDDYIEPRDLPGIWRGRRLTVDVEAKAKERAVLALIEHEQRQARTGRRGRDPAIPPPVASPTPSR